jgi:WD40 repeat protein/energy-coupling factor transporter ATP-binding protein EcfA2
LPGPGHRRKLFFFYAESDREIATKIFLPELLLEPSEIATREDLRLGAFVGDEFTSLVESSQYTLLLVSPGLLKEDWAKHVQALAKHANVEGHANLIVADLEKVQKPLDLRARVSLDFTDEKNWTGEFQRLRQFLQVNEPNPVFVPPCPYPGMLPYNSNANESGFFFYGREAEIRDILRRVKEAKLFFVIGPSASGKSSLVQAGLIPAFSRSSFFVRETWHITQTRPGPEPSLSLKLALREIEAHLSQRNTSRKPHRALLVVDQLEELFVTPAPGVQKDYIATLKKWTDDSRVKVIVVFRADFFSEIMESDFWPIAEIDRIEVAPLRGEALRRAIELPAHGQGVVIDRVLVDRLMVDAAEEPGPLPLLQETMVRLWDSIDHHYLSVSAYDGLSGSGQSGLARVLSDSADNVIQHLSPPEQRIARRIFLGLVQEGSGRPDTRRQRFMTDFLSADDDPELFDKTLETLISHRLLTADLDRREPVRKLDLAHEALIRSWRTLRDWLTKYREVRKTQDRLTEKAGEWLRRDRQGGMLDRHELAEAERWLADPLTADLGQSELVLSYIAESRSALEASDRLEQQRLKMTAEAAERRAEVERLYASDQRRLRLQSVSLYLSAHLQLGTEARERAALLAREAHLLDEASGGSARNQVYAALVSALEQPDLRIGLRAPARVDRLCLSNEGALLASVDWEGSIRLWDLSRLSLAQYSRLGVSSTSEQVHTFGCRVQSMCFSTDSHTLGVLADNGNLALFAVSPGCTAAQLIGTQTGLPKRDHSVINGARNVLIYDSAKQEFTVDGNEYSRASARRIIVELGLDVPVYTTFRGGSPLHYTTVSSPDAKLLLVRNPYPSSQTVSLWKLDSPQPWIQELTHGSIALDACFSSDSKKLFFGSQVWDTNWPPQSLPPLSLRAPDPNQTSLAIDAHGTTVAMGHHDGEIWIWRNEADSATCKRCALPEPFDSSCFDGRGRVVGWAENGRAISCETSHDGPGIALSIAPYALFETRQTATERLAYEIWTDGGYRQRGAENDWRAAVRVRRIRDAAKQLFDESGRISRLLCVGDGEHVLATWPCDPTHPPALLSLSAALQGLPLAVGHAMDGCILIASSTHGVGIREAIGWVYRITGDREVVLHMTSSGEWSSPLAWAVFSPNGQFLLAQERRRGWGDEPSALISLRSLNEPDLKPRTLIADAAIPNTVAFSPDNRKLALAFSEPLRNITIRTRKAQNDSASKILIYDTTGPDPMFTSSRSLRGDISAMAFSRDADTLAVGNSNGDIDLIDLRLERSNPVRAGEYEREIRSLYFDSNRSLLSVDANGIVRSTITDGRVLADAVCDRVSRNLSREDWNYFIGSDIPYRCTCPIYPAPQSEDK